MSLGSDVTTRYALKIDDAKKVLKKSEYAYANVKVVKMFPSETFILDEYLERIVLNFHH